MSFFIAELMKYRHCDSALHLELDRHPICPFPPLPILCLVCSATSILSMEDSLPGIDEVIPSPLQVNDNAELYIFQICDSLMR